MASHALASLTETYTDSEGEEDMDDRETPEKQDMKGTHSEPVSPKQDDEAARSASLPTSPRRLTRLVSYVDDAIVTDEEALSPSPSKDDMRRLSMETDTDDAIPRSDADESEEGIIPPEPPGKCSKELQDHVAKYYYRVQYEGLDMNRMIQDKKNFRNPSIYEKLIQFCDINELDTNYPPEKYDPLKWGKESYYEELAKAQKVEMDRREKEKKEKLAKIDFLSGNRSQLGNISFFV